MPSPSGEWSIEMNRTATTTATTTTTGNVFLTRSRLPPVLRDRLPVSRSAAMNTTPDIPAIIEYW